MYAWNKGHGRTKGLSYLSRSKLCLKLRGTMNAAAKKRLAVWKRLCWAASHSTQATSPTSGIKLVTIETFVSLTTLIFVVTSKLNDDVGDDDELQNSSVQTENSVKLPATGVAVGGGGSFVVMVCVLDVEPMSCGVTTIPPPPVSLSTPSDFAGRKTLFLMLMVVVVTSLLPSSVLVDVFGISSITDCVKSLKGTKIMFELTRFSACTFTP